MALDYDREEVELPQEIEEFLNEQLGEDASVEVVEEEGGFRVSGEGEGWLFLAEGDAEQYAVRVVVELLDDIGLEGVNLNFEDFVGEDGENWFKEAMGGSYQSYIEGIEEEGGERLEREMEEAGVEDGEEYLEYLCNSWGTAVDWYKDNFGEDDFLRVIKEHGLIDIDEVAREIVRIDGVGLQLARYDGEEHELGGGWLGYRED